jgi:hypothetical protein
MHDPAVYVILGEIRDLMRQSVELQKQTLAEVRKQVEMEKSVVDSELFATHISSDLFSELLGQITTNCQDNDNREEEDN